MRRVDQIRIAIIGASKDRSKFGNKAVRAYLKKGHEVFPVNPHEDEIEGLRCYASVKDIPGDVEVASFYLPPEVGEKVADEVIEKGVGEVYLNPGSESGALVQKLGSAGIRVRLVCSILAVGEDLKEL